MRRLSAVKSIFGILSQVGVEDLLQCQRVWLRE
jgi:hypothetical protein